MPNDADIRALCRYVESQVAISQSWRVQKRNCTIREVRRIYYQLASGRQFAAAFSARLTDYRAGARQRERTLDAAPERYTGREEHHLWQILRLVDRSLSASQVRAILVDGA